MGQVGRGGAGTATERQWAMEVFFLLLVEPRAGSIYSVVLFTGEYSTIRCTEEGGGGEPRMGPLFVSMYTKKQT